MLKVKNPITDVTIKTFGDLKQGDVFMMVSDGSTGIDWFIKTAEWGEVNAVNLISGNVEIFLNDNVVLVKKMDFIF